MGKMILSIYMEGNYEEIHALKAAEKQSQTKPNYSYCVLCIASWFCHSCGNGNPVFWVVMDSASSAE